MNVLKQTMGTFLLVIIFSPLYPNSELYKDFCEINHQTRGKNHVSLENELIQQLDGVQFMIDGISIKEMMVFIRDLLRFQQGELDKASGKHVGYYQFHGKKYGIHTLSKIEQRYPEHTGIQKELQELLIKAKYDIIEMLRPFIDQVLAMKILVLPIITEWIEKAHKPDTFLIKWTDCDGNEEEIFRATIQTMSDLDIFCSDLRQFLGDLIDNCPKGKAQFEELLKQHENK